MKSKTSKTTLDSIGQRIAEVRKKILHLSQEKLANQVGVKLRTIQRYESGDNVPPEAFYIKLSDINEMIDINWIKTGEGNFLKFVDPLNSFSFDYEAIHSPVKVEDCKQILSLALAEIKMLRAALVYKDSVLKVLINQTVKL